MSRFNWTDYIRRAKEDGNAEDLSWLEKQARDGTTGFTTCMGCLKPIAIHHSFRCLYCGIYRCAEKHFGVSLEEWRASNSGDEPRPRC